MNQVKEHFEDEAQDFDRIILTLIPDYLRMVASVIAAIPFDSTAAIRVIDLGCGTGTLAQEVLKAFPNAHVTCLDVAENMIRMARNKLACYRHVRYIVDDFNVFDSDGHYDAVVSSLALHHLATDEDKQRFYRRIYAALNDGGVFYNADVVLGSNDFLQAVYMHEWRAFMSHEVSEVEIEGKWIPKYYAEDRPAKLVEQLSWLAEVGFVYVDVLWKHYNFAVYGGVKR